MGFNNISIFSSDQDKIKINNLLDMKLEIFDQGQNLNIARINILGLIFSQKPNQGKNSSFCQNLGVAQRHIGMTTTSGSRDPSSNPSKENNLFRPKQNI